MNQVSVRSDSLKGESMTPGKRVGPESSKVSERCNCQRCGLLRYYPPMMLITTAAAAVFCWLYVTKPVFVTGVMEQPPVVEEISQDQAPRDEHEPVFHPEVTGALDPGIGTLPGDEVPPDGKFGEDHIPAEELKPLIVKRQGPSLFRPIPREEMPPKMGVAEARPAILKGDAHDRTDRNQSAIEEVVSSGGGGEVREDRASGDLHVHASFMAEFSAVERVTKKQSQP